MSKKLTQARADYTDKLKRLKLLEAGVDYNDVDTYVKYLASDDEKEIEKEAQAIVADIKQQSTATDVYHDERTWKPF
ncbi:hypothetical protein ACFFIS_04745 [Virgibacillus soli]|uniref:Uncharacterized protein n=1 Tax=Paracerasibacillus soli TaxID=480284 RepID=A0ABU5CUC5_9BACI|nr:hypothetical protein [Virgibacillus soli]MDY0409967.1 hypothetical protein [Virgibacillus soli]